MRRFHRQVTDAGGQVLEPTWLGANRGHRVTCSAGHTTTPRPDGARRSGSICRICAGRDVQASEQKFRARVAALGGEVLEETWLGNRHPHRVRCRSGHAVSPSPSSIINGQGPCRACVGANWDLLYVVVDPRRHRVKFGITSADSTMRLQRHRGAGYTHVTRVVEGLADAPQLERAVLATLKLAGLKPLHGREYFDASALAVIIDVVDNWPVFDTA